MNSFNISCLQQPGYQTREVSFKAYEMAIEKAKSEDANLVVLPELHNNFYFCQTEDVENYTLAETIPGPSTEFYSELARKHKLVLVISLFEKRVEGVYHNTAVVIDTNGEIAGKYRKMHIPDDPSYYEKFYFTLGDLGFHPIETSLGKLGILVCWDQWFPEAARIMALQGAEILIYPTAIGWISNDNDPQLRKQQLLAWQTIQRSHAIANGLFVATCNRSEFEKSPDSDIGIDFWGHSFICGPQGEILSETNQTPAIISANIDKAKIAATRQGWPYFRDRRVDAYQTLLKIAE